MKQISSIPNRFRALDAWRGICALLVVLFHAPTLHLFKDTAGFANLQLCVDFFFVLSGFVITHAYSRRLASPRDGLDFMGARFRRLWPLHVVVLTLFVAFELLKLAYGYVHPGFGLDAAPFSAGHAPLEIVTNLFFLQSFGLHPGLSWNGPAWSIAVEFWVSVVFALVLCLTPRRRLAIFAGLAAVSAAILAVASPQTLFVSHDFGFLRCLFGFSVGCVLYDLRLMLPSRRLASGPAEAVALGLAVAFVLLTAQGPLHLLAPLLFAGLIYVFSFEAGPISKVLATPLPQALGRWSFSIYMTHMLVFQLMRTIGTLADKKFDLHAVVFHNGDKLLVIGGGLTAFLATLAIIALIVVPLGAFFHHFVERPFGQRPATGPAPARMRAALRLQTAE